MEPGPACVSEVVPASPAFWASRAEQLCLLGPVSDFPEGLWLPWTAVPAQLLLLGCVALRK